MAIATEGSENKYSGTTEYPILNFKLKPFLKSQNLFLTLIGIKGSPTWIHLNHAICGILSERFKNQCADHKIGLDPNLVLCETA